MAARSVSAPPYDGRDRPTVEANVEPINAVRDRAPRSLPDARVLPLWRASRVNVLDAGELGRLRGAVERRLADDGVVVPSAYARARLGTTAAVVDDERKRVHLPASLVDSVLQRATAPSVLAGRDPACDLTLDGSVAWLGGGGVAATVEDLESGKRRPSTRDDVVQAARLADAVPQIGVVGPVAAPDVVRDLPPLVAATGKHLQVEVPSDPDAARVIVAVASALAGGPDALGDRPPLSVVVTLDRPLVLERLDAAASIVSAGIPCTVLAGDAPLDRAIAGTLAAAVCILLLVPDAHVTIGAGAPGPPRLRMAWVQLAEDLRIRSQLAAFPTRAAGSDWRAGVEGGLAATAGWMSPPDVLAGAGQRADGRVSSLTALLLDAELFDLVRFIPPGFDVDDETLAVEVIADVGPAEHFLGEQHTLRHFREAWVSRCMDTNTWEAWEEAGRPEPPAHAADRVRELLASHEPPPLDPALTRAIEEAVR
jgi:trimethylamine--corrinoid protein Co-methyltransferase